MAGGIQSCGSPVKSGDTVVAYQLLPGQICWFRGMRSGASTVGRATVQDGTANGANIATFVRASYETRDVNDNVLQHVELH